MYKPTKVFLGAKFVETNRSPVMVTEYLIKSPTDNEIKELWDTFKSIEKINQYLCKSNPDPCGRDDCPKEHQ